MEKRVQTPHRKYDPQFKSEAIQQVHSGRSVPSVAKALGISDALLYQWIKKDKSVGIAPSSPEMEALRKQV
jgi:transposase-like protein